MRTKFGTLAVAALAAAMGLSAHAFAQQAMRPPPTFASPDRDCFMTPDVGVADLDAGGNIDGAARCESIANGRPRLPRNVPLPVALSYAYFHGAKASRILAERPANSGRRTELLETAARLFSAAKSSNPEGLPDASLELARVRRLQGQWDDANAALTALEGAGRADPILGASVSYEQAMLVLDRLRAESGEPDPSTPMNARELDERRRAASYLRDFASHDALAPYVAYRGFSEQASVANALGLAAMDLPAVEENVREAVERFRDAQGAIERLDASAVDRPLAGQIYFNLGRARLREAGLRRDARAPELECPAPTDAPIYVPGDTEANFRTAKNTYGNADGDWGMGCVELMRQPARQLSGAINSFNAALAAANASNTRRTRGMLQLSDYYVALGRALLRRNEGQDSLNAIRNFDQAIGRVGGDSAQASRIRVELAQALRYNDPERAERELSTSISDNRDVASYMLRAEIRVERGNLNGARDDFEVAARELWPRRADASARLSDVYSTLANRSSGNVRYNYQTLAISAATNAYDYESNPQRRWDNRVRACLMRIALRRPAGAEAYCGSGERANDPEALFYEGLYHLREAYRLRGAAQSTHWGQALVVFEHARDNLGRATRPNITILDVRDSATAHDLTQFSLARLVEYGIRFSRHCAISSAANPQAPGDQASDQARTLFADHLGFDVCAR